METVLIKDAVTALSGGEYSIPPQKELDFPGAAAPFHRAQIVVTNSSASNNIFLVVEGGQDSDGQSGTRAAQIFPGSNITLFTSARIKVRNSEPGAGLTAIVRVLEVFYR